METQKIDFADFDQVRLAEHMQNHKRAMDQLTSTMTEEQQILFATCMVHAYMYGYGDGQNDFGDAIGY